MNAVEMRFASRQGNRDWGFNRRLTGKWVDVGNRSGETAGVACDGRCVPHVNESVEEIAGKSRKPLGRKGERRKGERCKGER